MKKILMQLFCQYRLLVFFNIIMLIGYVFSIVFADIYNQTNALFSFNFHAVYVFAILPIYSLLYGIASYAIYKKILYPQFLLSITSILSFLLDKLIYIDTSGMIVGFFILTPCYMVVSFIGIAVILIPCKLIKK